MDGVKVHRNSPKPPNFGALAYTKGTEIHVGPGHEQHLAHEAWHVVQQMQGRVKPTLWTRRAGINDDTGLEKEASEMGAKALQMNSVPGNKKKTGGVVQKAPVQMFTEDNLADVVKDIKANKKDEYTGHVEDPVIDEQIIVYQHDPDFIYYVAPDFITFLKDTVALLEKKYKEVLLD